VSDRRSALEALAGRSVFDPVATPRVADVIAERLTRVIRDGLLQPGDRLPTEQELAREFGVGRTSVREGPQKLRAYGLIETRKGLGAFVTSPSSDDPLADFARWTARDPAAIEKLLEVRVALETLAAGTAAVRASDEDKAAVEQHCEAHAAAAQARDVSGLVRTDEAFHEGIFAAGRNQILGRLYDLLTPELTDFRRKTLALPWAAAHSVEGHRAIVAAIRRADPAAARQAMGDHLLVLYNEVHESATSDGAEPLEFQLAPRSGLV
jgi:GntR family transcriptional regulator, transcriptional repressor for pyruvate dehydrogenase complex